MSFFHARHAQRFQSSPVYSLATDGRSAYVALDQCLNLLAFGGGDYDLDGDVLADADSERPFEEQEILPPCDHKRRTPERSNANHRRARKNKKKRNLVNN